MSNIEHITDKHGFLIDLRSWSPEVAEQLAADENIVLTEAHWEIIYLLRDFYNEFELSPAMRVLVKHVKTLFGEEKGNSVYLLSLFPGSPAKIASKIAGLPKPTNCL